MNNLRYNVAELDSFNFDKVVGYHSEGSKWYTEKRNPTATRPQ